jgi:hypothetical protein
VQRSGAPLSPARSAQREREEVQRSGAAAGLDQIRLTRAVRTQLVAGSDHSGTIHRALAAYGLPRTWPLRHACCWPEQHFRGATEISAVVAART